MVHHQKTDGIAGSNHRLRYDRGTPN